MIGLMKDGYKEEIKLSKGEDMNDIDIWPPYTIDDLCDLERGEPDYYADYDDIEEDESTNIEGRAEQ